MQCRSRSQVMDLFVTGLVIPSAARNLLLISRLRNNAPVTERACHFERSHESAFSEAHENFPSVKN
jgi:hypothetical protein